MFPAARQESYLVYHCRQYPNSVGTSTKPKEKNAISFFVMFYEVFVGRNHFPFDALTSGLIKFKIDYA